MISDFVKGKKKYDYPTRILAGINLHRSIDEFTDDHPVNKEVSKIFKPAYGRYGPAIVDVLYDHFLAVEIAASSKNFEQYTVDIYRDLEKFKALFPVA